VNRIRVSLGGVVVTATLNDSNTAQRIWAALPIESQAARWGDEVYLRIPVDLGEEDPRADVPSGTVAYWPPGQALCLFFGQKPYSPVNVVGEIEGDPQVLATVEEGEAVRVEGA
jgi:hypothetical protein